MSDPSETSSHKQRLHELILHSFEASLGARELSHRRDALAEMAEDGTGFAQRRQPGEIKVRVANPGGQRESCTVIEALLADQPFLVDTFRLVLERLRLRELLLLHPLLAIERDDDGSVVRCGKRDVGRTRESYVYAEVARVVEADQRQRIEQEFARAMSDVASVVADHAAMLGRLREHISAVNAVSQLVPDGAERASRISDFLEWLASDNFVFFGYRAYDACREGESWSVTLDGESGLGIMRDDASSRFRDAARGEDVAPLVRARLAEPRLVFFDKSRSESTIHRHGRLDSVSIKVLDENGAVAGFGRFVGLLTHQAMRTRPSGIPILAQRRERVLETLDVERGSHTYKTAAEGYDSLPIEFLFASDVASISCAVRRILSSAEHRQVEVFVVPDPLNRSFFVSVMLPRPLYDEQLRVDLHDLLTQRYGASYIDHRSSFLDDEIALIHFFCSSPSDVDIELLTRIESEIKGRVVSWEERFADALREAYGSARASRLFDAYRDALPQEHRQQNGAAEAVSDVECLERLEGGSALELSLSRQTTLAGDSAGSERYRLKLYLRERPYLTDLLPVLDHLGLRAIDAKLCRVEPDARSGGWIVTFRLEDLGVAEADRADAEARVLDGLRAVFSGRVEDDLLNRLLLAVGLDWRTVDVLRAYLAFASQLGAAPTRGFAAEVLARRPAATRTLARLFFARFDPERGGDRAAAEAAVVAELEQQRSEIPTAGEDRVFHVLCTLIRATNRHSFFGPPQEEGAPHELAFKVASARVDWMPRPRPFAEIFVHSSELLGVHLRGGKVARGGLRWSDRPHDLRSEILGLMKTQMTKNGLIVPVGSKGGFVLRRASGDPMQARAEADRLYARFTRRLLLLTDNSVGGAIVPPERVVRHDGDDPYLVVAADKGTAHLSDVANAVAESLGFWLGDAFASGGSLGYDHKKEGITARGAWICVRRHFLEMDVDIERDVFTISGVGDMSGDVFGNGLLLARRGKLLAAFNHAHIFIDPDPDPETSWAERKRLFELPRSSWRDYDESLLSAGGGVFERGARSIALSPQARQVLQVDAERVSGEELIQAVLRMPIDLLWNGGIGTYVKASCESHADVGDRANESVRIDAGELRARVVAEGGNCGFTQLARVEYAQAGGRINTDAIDNSGGVDLSDHEVNYKILLARSVAEGRLAPEQRVAALAACVQEADASVLRHNLWQSRCLSMDQVRSWQDPERMALTVDFLVERADLDPKLEYVPDRDALRVRATQSRTRASFTRPELAILLGYTKMLCKRALVASTVPERASLLGALEAYFPASLRLRFATELAAHPLRREIASTWLTNRVIDRAGVTLVAELARSQSVEPAEVIAAYHLADTILGAEVLRERLEALELPEGLRLRAWLRLEEALRLGTTVCLTLGRRGLLGEHNLAAWSAQTAELRSLVPGCLAPGDAVRLEERAGALAARGLPDELARAIECLPGVVRSFEAASLAMQAQAPLRATVELYARVGEFTRIGWLLERLADLEASDGWTRACVEALYLEMLEAQRMVTAGLIDAGDSAAFEQSAAAPLRQIEQTASRIEAEPSALAPLVVLSQQIRRLC